MSKALKLLRLVRKKGAWHPLSPNVMDIILMATRSDSPFLVESRELLIAEFGRDYGTYFSILRLVAVGKNSQSEIDSIIGKNTGAYLVIPGAGVFFNHQKQTDVFKIRNPECLLEDRRPVPYTYRLLYRARAAS